VTPATLLIVSAPLRVSPEARLRPSTIEATSEFWSTVVATIVSTTTFRTMVLTCSIAFVASVAAELGHRGDGASSFRALNLGSRGWRRRARRSA